MKLYYSRQIHSNPKGLGFLWRNEINGFTLVELTVSLVIVSVVMVAVYRTFNVGWMSWDKTLKESEALQNARTLIKIMTRDLRTVVSPEPVMGMRSDLLKREYFKLIGTENSLQMICYSRPVSYYWPENFPRRSNICYVSYYINPGTEDTLPCVYRKVKWDIAILPWKDEEVEILDGITDIKFSYFNDSKGKWETEWNTDEIMKHRGMNFHGVLPICVSFSITAQSRGFKPALVNLKSITRISTFER